MIGPVILEIGCGKGDFICEAAKTFPECKFIAVEKIPDVIISAIEKIKTENLSNVKFIISDAKNLAEILPENSVNKIFLNFSDPWPKRYQYNKRLTSGVFISMYKKIMTPKAKIILKTDNANFFDYSVKNLILNDFCILDKTNDLYNTEFLKKNIQTEYEKKFVAQDIKICYLKAEYNI
jgi:tRNA (guanine-N7-)-methyltransferase